jgi:transglutaminase-like putative cysteine protease
VASNRQVIESTEKGKAVVLLARGAIPTNATAPLALTDDLKPYLVSTPYVQADDPGIVKQARRITEDLTNNFDKAMALFDWVYLNVQKRPTVSLPSAVDVLKRMEGDCNEHTYLYVALARAMGIPTQIRVGLLYKDGVFYYHAWPSVFVGDWMEMDPTLGQHQVDVTHIALLEGELANQMKLLQVFGRMSVDVLDEKSQ